MDELSKQDVKKIVRDEIKKFVTSDLDKEIEKLLKSLASKTRKASTEQIKDGISKLAEFLWIRRNIWKSDIK